MWGWRVRAVVGVVLAPARVVGVPAATELEVLTAGELASALVGGIEPPGAVAVVVAVRDVVVGPGLVADVVVVAGAAWLDVRVLLPPWTKAATMPAASTSTTSAARALRVLGFTVAPCRGQRER